MREIQLDDKQRYAFEQIETGRSRNFYIQGQAGTGKSLLINYLREHLDRRVAVVAPTGVAAQLIGGSTIHSMFKLGAHPYFPQDVVNQYKNYEKVVELVDTLVIDEASMLRADVLDTVDVLCRKAKTCRDRVFGGIQVVLVGDLYQLPPVYDTRDNAVLDYMVQTYGVSTPFFFDAKCYAEGKFEKLELSVVHRQEADGAFLGHLQAISLYNTQGNQEIVIAALDSLNTRVSPGCREMDIPIVTARRAEANRINDARLAALPGQERTYTASYSGEYYATGNPGTDASRKEAAIVPEKLVLKPGAKVMFCRNEVAGNRYVNGTFGTVEQLGDTVITVRTSAGVLVEVGRERWDIQEYRRKGSELVLETVGTCEQYPLKLAYAITIHKSQGQTWDEVCIDMGDHGAFAPGQTYVALSRARCLAGVHLVHRLNLCDVKTDPRVRAFLQTGKTPLANEVILPARSKDGLVGFWKKFFPDINQGDIGKHFANKGARCWEGQRYTCFWFTVDKTSLFSDLYLICSDMDKAESLLFKVPGNTESPDSLGLNLGVRSNDGRHDPRRRNGIVRNCVDIFMGIGGDFKELYKRKVTFKPYLLAMERNGELVPLDEAAETEE